MNDQNHHAQTQSRIASIIVERVIDNLGGSHTLGDVERKVKLYNSLHSAFGNEGLLEDAEPYLKPLRASFLND